MVFISIISKPHANVFAVMEDCDYNNCEHERSPYIS